MEAIKLIQLLSVKKLAGEVALYGLDNQGRVWWFGWNEKANKFCWQVTIDKELDTSIVKVKE